MIYQEEQGLLGCLIPGQTNIRLLYRGQWQNFQYQSRIEMFCLQGRSGLLGLVPTQNKKALIFWLAVKNKTLDRIQSPLDILNVKLLRELAFIVTKSYLQVLDVTRKMTIFIIDHIPVPYLEISRNYYNLVLASVGQDGPQFCRLFGQTKKIQKKMKISKDGQFLFGFQGSLLLLNFISDENKSEIDLSSRVLDVKQDFAKTLYAQHTKGLSMIDIHTMKIKLLDITIQADYWWVDSGTIKAIKDLNYFEIII